MYRSEIAMISIFVGLHDEACALSLTPLWEYIVAYLGLVFIVSYNKDQSQSSNLVVG